MKATGIVRRIDDLGRVVIPKEIRRTMRIREGDPLEIYTDAQGEVIFKKYSPMGDLAEFTAQYAEVLNKALGVPVFITDRDHVIAFGGPGKREYMDGRVSPALEAVMEQRAGYLAGRGEPAALYALERGGAQVGIAVPILSNGDVSGCVGAFLGKDGGAPSESEYRLLQVAAQFLGKQTED